MKLPSMFPLSSMTNGATADAVMTNWGRRRGRRGKRRGKRGKEGKEGQEGEEGKGGGKRERRERIRQSDTLWCL